MYQDTYFVAKSTDTFADILLAYGLAHLLEKILRDNKVDDPTVRIQDAGSAFLIRLDPPITEGYENIPWFCNLPWITTTNKEGKKKLPPDGWSGVSLDYAHKQNERKEYSKIFKQLPPEAKRDATHPARTSLPPAPDIDLDFYEMINQMGSMPSYTQILETWLVSKRCFPDVLRLLLTLFSNPLNELALAKESWNTLVKRSKLNSKQITPVQSINPAMGKGVYRAKMDGATRLDDKPEAFWLAEFLKFLGAYKSAVPRIVKTTQPKGPRDRKTYILHPCNITLNTHNGVFRTFKRNLWADTAIKMDILAALRYTEIFLDRWIAGQAVDIRFGEQPGDYVLGLAAAYYKDLGSAVALLNLSEISLPRWMENVSTKEDAESYRQMIIEHRRIIRNLQEKKAEEHRILQDYRDFLSAHDIHAFFKFSTSFSNLVMDRLEKNQSIQFSIQNLEVLMDAHDKNLKSIYTNPGFRNLAAAIRRSTVIPQRKKAKKENYPYKPRYGLGAELMRNAAYPDKFMFTLSEFVHDFSTEVQRVYERFEGKPPQPFRRAQVTDADLQQVMDLIDIHGSQLIAGLLVAFGYARGVSDRDVLLDAYQDDALEDDENTDEE